MLGRWLSRRHLRVALVAAVEGLGLLLLTVSMPAPVQAQWNDRRWQVLRRESPWGGGGFFENLFGGFDNRAPPRERVPRYRPPPEPQRHIDYSRAPAPSKHAKPEPGVPMTTIVVMGDGMADWLAYGLEDAFSDSPNVEIVRRDKQYSGLIHYQAHSALDWPHVARDILAQQNANYVVMMLGIHDRQNISERDLAKEVEKQQADKQAADQAKTGTGKDATGKDKAAGEAAKAPQRANGTLQFRTDQWAKAYSQLIDETIAALKSKGVPVFWVGLPSIRGTKSTADALYLDDLYRARAERDGAIYIDVWDGFVDDSGKYTSYGPDYEGQMRRLRSPDGVFFTKYGARKLAHYVEREIRRYMNNRAVMALPTGPVTPAPGNESPAARPLAGPVLPLTGLSGGSDVLLGGAGTSPARSDAVASSVLVKGDPLKAPPGRADDHAWPLGSAVYGAAPKVESKASAAPARSSPAASPPPAVAAATESKSAPATSSEPVARTQQSSPAAMSAPQAKAAPEPAHPARERAAPAEAQRYVSPEATEVRNAARSRRESTARAREREASRSILPRRVERRPREVRPPPPSRADDGFFGPNGPFGWIQ